MTSGTSQSAIGGYFSLEVGLGQGLAWLRSAVGFQSARSAIAAVLRAAKANTVWAPHYICDAVNDALATAGVHVKRYELSENRGVPADVDLNASDWLLCVDYFGLSAGAIDDAIRRFGVRKLLVDASQSLYYSGLPGLTTVYSPRKFVGIPDGGFLLSEVGAQPTIEIEAEDLDSVGRCQHLLTRLSGQIASGYSQFQKAEESLSSCKPVAMSRLTRRLIESINFDRIASRRIRNYRRMSQTLSRHGLRVETLPEGAVPLCCPVFDVDAVQLRQRLAARNIFTPVYWADSLLPQSDRIACSLRDRTVFLPCDQRYGEVEIMNVVQSMLDLREVS